MSVDDYWQMQKVTQFRATVFSKSQQRTLGEILAGAISQGRGLEVRSVGKSILVLTTPADDLGHVWRIDRKGDAEDIGVTGITGRS